MTDWPAVWTAVGTLSLAAVGAGAWWQNRSLVKSSGALVTETQRDRELRWAPVPSVHWTREAVGTGGPRSWMELTNAGGGPAISCRVVIKQHTGGVDGWLSRAVDIPSGETKPILADQVLDTSTSIPLSTWYDDEGFGHNVESLGAIFTKDILGYRYRFLVVKDGDTRAIIERYERWRPGETPEPSWAGYRVIWPDYGIGGSPPNAVDLSDSGIAGQAE